MGTSLTLIGYSSEFSEMAESDKNISELQSTSQQSADP